MPPAAFAEPPPAAPPAGTAPGRARDWLPPAVLLGILYATLPVAPAWWGEAARHLGAVADHLAALLLLLCLAVALLAGRRSLRAAGPAHWLAAAVLAAGYAAVLTLPPLTPAEKLHLLIYGAVALLVWRAWRRRSCGGCAIFWRSAWVVTAAGAGEEALQWLLPNRYFELKDIALNAAAGLLALGVAALWSQVNAGRRGHRGREPGARADGTRTTHTRAGGGAAAAHRSRRGSLDRNVLLWLVTAGAALLQPTAGAIGRGPVSSAAGGSLGPPAAAAPARSGTPTAEPLNVVILTIDSLRADHLGLYGYGRPTSPALDAFAAQAVVFDHAYATSAWTFPGVVSMMTGLMPVRHGYDARGRVMHEVPTLQSIARGAGYRVPTLNHLAPLPELRNLAFEPVWRAPDDPRRAGDLVQWLRSEEARTAPFVAWGHLREPHLPYDAPEQAVARFGATTGSAAVERLRRFVIVPAEAQAFLPDDRPAVVDLYDAQLPQVDRFLAEVVAALRDSSLQRRTVVVVTADHGEELLEHGLVGHASTNLYAQLYDEILRVPLILYAPGLQPARIGCRVSQIDLLPTLLDLLGLEAPASASFDGVDLLPLLEGAPCPERALFASSIEGGFQAHGRSARRWVFAVRQGRHKLILRRDDQAREWIELYDLAADPREQRDLARADPARAAHLRRLLAGYHERAGGVQTWWRPLLQAPPNPAAATLATAPVVLWPRDGERVAWAGAEGILAGVWSGSPVAEYVIEYDIGEGTTETRGTITVRGNRFSYGPVPQGVWNELATFNPWRVRVYPAGRPELASDWVRFELVPAPPCAPCREAPR